jgi:hypothetical protein
LLGLQLQAQETFDEAFFLAPSLVSASHGLLDLRKGREPFATGDVHHMIRMPFGRGHERLEATDAEALLICDGLSQQLSRITERLGQPLGVGQVQLPDARLKPGEVELHSLRQFPDQPLQILGHP